MDFYIDVKEHEEKLTKVLAEHHLLHDFHTAQYPITLTVKQNRTPDAQRAIFAGAEGSMSSCDAVLRFIFKLEGLEVQTDSRWVISDTLFNKIKGLTKKLHAAYTAAYFAEHRNPERLELYGDPDSKPVVNEPAEDTDFSEFQ